MSVLLTAGTGKTGSRIVPHLRAANIPYQVATRNPKTPEQVKFDWSDASTFNNPFTHPSTEQAKINAVFLVAPEVEEPAPIMNEFIDLAVKNGVKRFVLLSGTNLEKGGAYTGKVWQHLDDLGEKVEYTVLLCTWFNENFADWMHATSIKHENKFYSACADGKIPLIGSVDIAAVAFHALTNKPALSNTVRVQGSELLTYDDVASKLSAVLGREIVHVKLSREEREESFKKLELDANYAWFMTDIEVLTAGGQEDKLNDDVFKITGKQPQLFSDWTEENKSVW